MLAADHAASTQLLTTGTRLVPTPRAFSAVERSKTKQAESRFFPVSAFLACPDPTGRYPSASKFSSSVAAEPPLPRELVDAEQEGRSEPLVTVASATTTRNCSSPSHDHGPSALAVTSCRWNLQPGISATQTPIRWLPKSATQSRPTNHCAEPNAGSTESGRTSTALITAPIGSQRPFINMTPLRFRPVVPMRLFSPKMQPDTPPNQPIVLRPAKFEVQHDSRNFLDLGHANPCWCSTHADSVALEKNQRATVEQSPMPPATTELESGETVRSSMESPVGSALLSSSLQELRSPCDASTVLSDDWTVLPCSSHGHGPRSRSISSCESIQDDEEIYLISPASYATSRPPTPMPSPEDGMSESSSGSSSSSLCVLSPSGSSVDFIRSPWDEGECQVCQRYICVCYSASTSAAELPLLQNESGVEKIRHELRGGTLNMDDVERIWELDCAWFL